MRFTFRELMFDLAIVVLAAVVWFYTDRQAVRDALDTGIATIVGS